MKYLVDTSALTRILRKQADPRWYEWEERGLLSVCEPILAESLLIATGTKYAAIERYIVSRYIWVAVPDGVWDLVAALRRGLVPHSAHRGLSVADFVIAATAIRLKLTVLHEDGDYETLARFVPELKQRRIGAVPA
jgi:predicted nucleic acid-binding protein